MKLAAVAVLVLAALAAPASALAAPQLAAPIPAAGSTAQTASGTILGQPLNVTSDRQALNAYATYLTALVKAAPTSEQSSITYVSTVSSQCKSALESLTQPDYQVDAPVQETLTQIGEEMGDDLSITFDAVAVSPFMRLYSSLSRLRWTRASGGANVVKRFLTTEDTVLTIAPSELCQNALLAASAPQTVPSGTRIFLKSYTKASNAANTALANFLKLLETYETTSEKTLVGRITTLANEVSKLTKSDLLGMSTSLTATLES